MSIVKVRFASRRRSFETKVADVPSYQLLHRGIVGMKIEGRPAVNFPEHLRWGTDPRFDDRRLPVDLALRVEHFMIKHFVDGVQDFNCFTFMRYVTGLYHETGGIRSPRKLLYSGIPVPHETVDPGVGYIMQRNGVMMHGVVGFTRTVCLSVLGDNQPLTWAPTSDLMQSYGCDTLMEVHSVGTLPDL